ncbi:UNVERIFIED_CONTAM: hypothetical protein HDU68_009536 [Siphonaria sp. JEL0065]|nr:hypothetical protein HDU68_009536 [Siphonaria sp. JEL0065]
MNTTYQFQAFFSANSSCIDTSLHRIDLVPQACKAMVLNTGTQLSGQPSCSNSSFANYDVITGCINYSDVINLGNHLWHAPESLARVQFSTFEDLTCSQLPSLISEYRISATDCIHNVQNFNTLLQNGSAGAYATERMTLDFTTNSIYRTYFAQDCQQPLQFLAFPNQDTCKNLQKVHRINDFGITLSTSFYGGSCTQPADVTATIAIFNTECNTRSCNNDAGRADTATVCVQNTTDKINTILTGNYIALSYFLDDNCTIPSFTEAFRPGIGFCKATAGNTSFNLLGNVDGTITVNSYKGTTRCAGQSAVTNFTPGVCREKTIVNLGVGSGPSGSTPVGDGLGGKPVIICIVLGVLCVFGLIGLAAWKLKLKKEYLKLENQVAALSLNNVDTPPIVAVSSTSSTVYVDQHHDSEDAIVSSLEIEMESFSVLKPDPTPILDHTKPDVPPIDSKVKENPLFHGLSTITTYKHLEATAGTEKYDRTPQISTENSSSYAQEPQQWTVSQVAAWVSQNGGTSDPVYDQFIDGRALLALGVEDLLVVLKITVIEKRVEFSIALESLKAPPPSYLD